jgi:hypothetical protein
MKLLSIVGMVLIGLSLTIGMSGPSPVLAASSCTDDDIPIEQQNLDQDAPPELTTILCNFHTENDRILVYDGAGDMSSGDTWQTTTDFDDDTWIFDAASDGTAQLIIQFSHTNTQIIAALYSDVNNDSHVSYQFRQNRIVITESAHPPIRVVLRSNNWYLPDGKLNWNVRFETDGPAVFRFPYRYSIELLDVITLQWLDYMTLDGTPDTEFDFHDDDLDGSPEYHLWRLLATVPDFKGAARTRLWSNVTENEPLQPDNFLFWPYLAIPQLNVTEEDQTEYTKGDNYFDTPPVIEVNWDIAEISPPNFRGYPIEQGFHVNNIQFFEKNKINYANFEIEQGYYDLADDHDGRPELHIRHRYYGSNDPFGWYVEVPLNEIRYSWNQLNDSAIDWDYKLGLAGRQLMESQIDFPDFSYRAIPFLQLPSWVVNQNWDIVTLIASEDLRYASTEGLYEWGPIETGLLDARITDPRVENELSTLSRYLAGEIDIDAARAFQDLRPGVRGEYVIDLQDQPYLYFSPIDRRIHLVDAEQCLWNINDDERVECQNLDDDRYLDDWLYYENNELSRQIIQTEDYLIYSGDNEIIIKQVHVPRSLFETLPPSNHEEWLQLGQQLEDNAREFGGREFREMVDQFEGPTWHISQANLSDFRLTDNGFRFMIELLPHFEWTSDFAVNNMPDTDIGLLLARIDETSFQIAEFTNGQISLVPRTLPIITIDDSDIEIDTNDLIELNPVRINLTVHNHGLQDLGQLRVDISAVREDEEQFIGSTAISVPGQGEDDSITLIWTPRAGGDWVLRISTTYESSDQEQQALFRPSTDIVTSKTMAVSSAPRAGWMTFLSLNEEIPFQGFPIILFLGSLSVAAGALFILITTYIRQGILD